MAFLRLRGRKALLLHSLREEGKVKQLRLHAFDRDHPFTPSIRETIEERFPWVSINWELILSQLPPELVAPDEPPEEEGIDDEEISLEHYIATEQGYLDVLRSLSLAAPTRAEASMVQALLEYHEGKKPLALLRAILDALEGEPEETPPPPGDGRAPR